MISPDSVTGCEPAASAFSTSAGSIGSSRCATASAPSAISNKLKPLRSSRVPRSCTRRRSNPTIRESGRDRQDISYCYVLGDDSRSLLGVVDLRELVLAGDQQNLSEIMTAPVVTAEADDIQEDVAEIFAKYHFRMIPVVDAEDHLLGVIRYKDLMTGAETHMKV